MEYVITTYGAGEVLKTTFDAIASLISAKTGTLYQPLVRLGLIVGLVWATFSMIYGNHINFLHRWTIPLFLALFLFFAPTCTVHIHDPVSGSVFKVDNVPWGLGATAGVISKLGDRLTKEIEKTFSLPDDLKYHKTGAVMASHLIATAKTFHITNSDLAETLQSFITQCVVYDALLGKKYTLDDVKNSSNLWQLACDKPSPARSFTFKAPGKDQKSQIVTCDKGVLLLDQWLKKDVKEAFQHYEGQVPGRALGQKDSSPGETKTELPLLASHVPGSQLKQYLPGAFNYMTQMAKSAEDIMMQQMMMYAVVDSVENTSTSLGNAPNFAVRRAYLQQRATQETLAGVAAQKLIAMKNVLEALIYTAFIFILPLALLPSGWSFIGRWISLVLWIQLWPPLYAILNFIMNVSVKAKGIGMITSPSPHGSGLTIANSVGFSNLHADMAAQAGYMSIAVGTLAYAIVKGGAAGFSQLTSHLGSPSLGAANKAAEDMISGNYSFGNVTQGTLQAYNTTFGQQNMSPYYASGAFTQNDGVISRTTGTDGEHMVSIANSNLRSSLNLSESLSNNYTEQATKAAHLSENQMVAAAQAEADHNRNVMDFSDHKARQASSNDSYSTGETAGTNQSFTTLDGLVDRFAKEHSISRETAAQALARATASMSVGVGASVGGFGASATLTGETSVSAWDSKSDRDLVSKAIDYSKQTNFQDVLSRASQAARDMRYSELSDQGKRYVESIHDSYEKSHQYRNEASASLQKSQSFSEMVSWTKQNAGSINANLNQEYVNWLQTQSLPNSSGPMGIHEAETILSARPELDAQYQQRFMEGKMRTMENYIESHGLPESGADVVAAFQEAKGNITNPVDHQGGQNAALEAEKHGLGNDFKINMQPKSEVNEKLKHLEDQIIDQKEFLEKEAAQRKEGTPK